MAGSGIVSIGECMLELSGKGGDDWRMGFAGDTLNTLWALRALTGRERAANYVSAFGDDPFSRDQIAFFAANGIGIGESPVIAGARPGLYAITLTGAERSFTYWRNDSAARQLASQPDRLAKSLEGQSLVYFSGITLAILEPAARTVLIDAVGAAPQAGSLIAFDANYRPRLWASAEIARGAINEALVGLRHRAADVPGRAKPLRRRIAGSDSRAPGQLPVSARSWSRTATCRLGFAMTVGRKRCLQCMSPRQSTPPAPAIPSTAAISPRGWTDSRRSMPPAKRTLSQRRSCRFAARSPRSKRCAPRFPPKPC